MIAMFLACCVALTKCLLVRDRKRFNYKLEFKHHPRESQFGPIPKLFLDDVVSLMRQSNTTKQLLFITL